MYLLSLLHTFTPVILQNLMLCFYIISGWWQWHKSEVRDSIRHKKQETGRISIQFAHCPFPRSLSFMSFKGLIHGVSSRLPLLPSCVHLFLYFFCFSLFASILNIMAFVGVCPMLVHCCTLKQMCCCCCFSFLFFSFIADSRTRMSIYTSSSRPYRMKWRRTGACVWRCECRTQRMGRTKLCVLSYSFFHHSACSARRFSSIFLSFLLFFFSLLGVCVKSKF